MAAVVSFDLRRQFGQALARGLESRASDRRSPPAAARRADRSRARSRARSASVRLSAFSAASMSVSACARRVESSAAACRRRRGRRRRRARAQRGEQQEAQGRERTTKTSPQRDRVRRRRRLRIRPWPRCDRSPPTRRIHLGTGKGLRRPRALLKEAANLRKNLVNANSPVRDRTDASRREAGARALDHFLAAGFQRIEPPILQPAAAFLDMSGEDIRGRLYLTSRRLGRGTVPAARLHDPRLPRPSRRRSAGARRRNTPISARCFARARASAAR